MIDEKMFINLQSYKIGLLRSLIIEITETILIEGELNPTKIRERLAYIDSITIQAIKDGKINL